jgi:hypothetical protein
MKKIVFLIILIIIVAVISIAIFIHSVSNKEGLNGPGSSSPGTASTNPTMSSLDKFANALTTAFSPPAAPTINENALADWVNFKAPLSPGSSNINQCSYPIQKAVETLPIDQQSKEIIDKHAVNITSILDIYDAKLKVYEDLLNSSDKILGLNKNIDSVSNLGIPIATVIYDKDSNSLINLSVVKGVDGNRGDQMDKIDGLPVIGSRGSVGVTGENSLGDNIEELPYWSK